MCRTVIVNRDVKPSSLRFRSFAAKKPNYAYYPVSSADKDDQYVPSRQAEQKPEEDLEQLLDLTYADLLPPPPLVEEPNDDVPAVVVEAQPISAFSFEVEHAAYPSFEPPHYQEEKPTVDGSKDLNQLRSTVCAICRVDTGNFNLNYGANTCLSCRAVFRRAIQKTRAPNFVCKFGGGCQITEASRRVCKACRYQACLNAGMKPTCVMKGEEVQERFAKYIQRKKGVDKKATTMAHLNEPKIKGVRKPRRRRGQKDLPLDGVSQEQRRTLVKSAIEEGLLTSSGVDAVVQANQPMDLLTVPQAALIDYESPLSMISNEDAMLASPARGNGSSTGASVDDEDFSALFNLLQGYGGNDDLNSHSGRNSDAGGSSPSSDSGRGSVGEEMAGDYTIPLFEDFVEVAQQPQVAQALQESSGQQPSLIKAEKDTPDDEALMIDKVRSVRQTWAKACQDNTPNPSIVSAALQALANREKMSEPLAEDIRSANGQVFAAFLRSQQEFISLDDGQREARLREVCSSMIDYSFARAVSARTIEAQLQWLLLLSDAPAVPMGSLLRRVKAEDVLPAGANASLFSRTANTLTENVSFACVGTLALALLLQGDLRAKGHLLESIDWAQVLFSSASRQDLEASMDSLDKLAMATARGEGKMTEAEEEEWIKNRLADYDKAFYEESYGDDFVQECVMYSLGVPLSKHFFPQANKLFTVRLRKIMETYPEFGALPAAAKEAAAQAGVYAGTAVIRSKLEACPSGNAQFHIGLGGNDKEKMHDIYKNYGHTPRMRRVSLSEWNKAFGVVDKSTEDKFHHLCQAISPVASFGGLEGFKLMTLLAVFDASRHPALAAVAQRYLRALRRCLLEVGKHRKGQIHVKTEAQADAVVREALEKVADLSPIIRRVVATVL